MTRFSRLVGSLLMAVASLAPVRPALGQQADKDAVVAVVKRFLEAISTSDSAMARSTMMDEGALVSTVAGQAPAFRKQTFAAFLGMLGGGRKFLERMWNPQVLIDSGLATVWTPYDFHLDGKFSHCGIDVFTLLKGPDGWKISHVAYTVQRQGCAPSPLGPPAN